MLHILAGLQQNGNSVVVFFSAQNDRTERMLLRTFFPHKRRAGACQKNWGALPGQSSDLAFSRPVGAGANNFYIDREGKETT